MAHHVNQAGGLGEEFMEARRWVNVGQMTRKGAYCLLSGVCSSLSSLEARFNSLLHGMDNITA